MCHLAGACEGACQRHIRGCAGARVIAFLDVFEEVISSVTRTTAIAEKMGLKVGLLDKAIGAICNCRDQFVLSQKEGQLEAKLA